MMNRTQFLLGKIAEEAAEVAQRALKAQQFGTDEREPNQLNDNAERLARELDDLWAVCRMANDAGFLRGPELERQKRKREKVERYYAYSQACGQVEGSPLATNAYEWPDVGSRPDFDDGWG